MQSDEQIESWLNEIKKIGNDGARSKDTAAKLDDLEEHIKDRLEDPNLNFEDEYIEDVMKRLVDLRGIDNLPS
jgi:uncharacterized protein YgfB (UPF0149 family)